MFEAGFMRQNRVCEEPSCLDPAALSPGMRGARAPGHEGGSRHTGGGKRTDGQLGPRCALRLSLVPCPRRPRGAGAVQDAAG